MTRVFQTKPVQIKAFQAKEYSNDDTGALPSWGIKALIDRALWSSSKKLYGTSQRSGEDVEISDNDWIVQNSDGTVRVLDNYTFTITYVEVK